MKVVVQKSLLSSVEIEGKVFSSIDRGYVLLISFTNNDDSGIIDYIINKILYLRLFLDENKKMNLNIFDIKGSILSISQFTLYGDISNGARPSFKESLNYKDAEMLYNEFNEKLSRRINLVTGIFGADMKVNICNDGPVTIIIEKNKE